jgi:peptidoglycan/LPS O-acetylase OafA/YrhL
LTYNPALDGLRAVAIIVVMLFHARAPVALGGFIGVDVFFVLSGYLITTLLLRELETNHCIDLRRFYLRRLIRLTPALLVMLAIYVIVAPFVWPAIADHGWQAFIAAIYLSDYSVAFLGTPNLLSHTWSLSIEEHFYLLWPVVLVIATRRWDRRSLVIVLGAMYVLGTMLRWVCVIRGQSWPQVYYRFDTHLSGLVLGAWLAALSRDEELLNKVRRALPWLLWLPVVAIVCLKYQWGDIWMLMWGLSLTEWATVAVLIASQSAQGQVSAMLSTAPLVWIGKISYGLYLWHYPIFRYLRETHHWSDVLMIGLPLSVAIAATSYYTVESLGSKWRGRTRPQTSY